MPSSPTIRGRVPGNTIKTIHTCNSPHLATHMQTVVHELTLVPQVAEVSHSHRSSIVFSFLLKGMTAVQRVEVLLQRPPPPNLPSCSEFPPADGGCKVLLPVWCSVGAGFLQGLMSFTLQPCRVKAICTSPVISALCCAVFAYCTISKRYNLVCLRVQRAPRFNLAALNYLEHKEVGD